MERCVVSDEGSTVRFDVHMVTDRAGPCPPGGGMPVGGGNVWHKLMLYRCGAGGSDCSGDASVTCHGPAEVNGKVLTYRVTKMDIAGSADAADAAFRLDFFYWNDGQVSGLAAIFSCPASCFCFDCCCCCC